MKIYDNGPNFRFCYTSQIVANQCQKRTLVNTVLKKNNTKFMNLFISLYRTLKVRKVVGRETKEPLFI